MVVKKGGIEWIHRPKIYESLISFLVPNTPTQVEKKLGIKKLKLKPFLNKNLVKCLNPDARKGRFYVLTNKARRLIQLPHKKFSHKINWVLVGWIMASPKQRYVILKTMAVDFLKRTSEEIRTRASRLNPNLTRISTKGILKELACKRLVESEIHHRNRLYWINNKGTSIIKDIKNTVL